MRKNHPQINDIVDINKSVIDNDKFKDGFVGRCAGRQSILVVGCVYIKFIKKIQPDF